MRIPTFPFFRPKNSPLYAEEGVCFHAQQGETPSGLHIPNTLFVLPFFHPFFSIFFIFLIGLTDHSSFTSMLGSG